MCVFLYKRLSQNYDDNDGVKSCLNNHNGECKKTCNQTLDVAVDLSFNMKLNQKCIFSNNHH